MGLFFGFPSSEVLLQTFSIPVLETCSFQIRPTVPRLRDQCEYNRPAFSNTRQPQSRRRRLLPRCVLQCTHPEQTESRTARRRGKIGRCNPQQQWLLAVFGPWLDPQATKTFCFCATHTSLLCVLCVWSVTVLTARCGRLRVQSQACHPSLDRPIPLRH